MQAKDFVLRAGERGYNQFHSTGDASSYISGHPEAILSRHSSFNFGPYQAGMPGFGRIRVFGDEVFSGPGCGYNMHPHHDFIICAFVLEGQLTHINTVGNVDQLSPGDFYAFSAGSGGKHCEVNLRHEDLHVIYIWMLPDQLLLPPSYGRSHFNALLHRNRVTTLVGNADGSLRVSQQVRISRFVSDQPTAIDYMPRSKDNGVYVFVIDGELELDDKLLGRRDSAGTWRTERLRIRSGVEPTDVLIVETAP